MTSANPATESFGVHLILDLSECDLTKLRDLNHIYDMLDSLPHLLGMQKITQPYVFKYCGKVPEDKGITGFVIIAESHISIHTFEEKGYAFVDAFSCTCFDCEKAQAYIVEALSSQKVMSASITRGRDFPRSRAGGLR